MGEGTHSLIHSTDITEHACQRLGVLRVLKKQKRSLSPGADIPVGDNQLTNKQSVYFVSDVS